MRLDLKTPWPPSVNRYWRMARGQFYIAKPGKDYREEIRDIVFEKMVERQLTGRLSLRAELHAPDRRRRDIDNVLKAMLDAIQKSELIDDDNQFDELIVRRKEVAPPEGYVDVTIGELGNRASIESPRPTEASDRVTKAAERVRDEWDAYRRDDSQPDPPPKFWSLMRELEWALDAREKPAPVQCA